MNSSLIINTTSLVAYHGSTMLLSSKTSDADVIAQLCTSYSWWNVWIFGVVLFLFACKAYIYRTMQRKPDFKAVYGWQYESLCNIMDMIMIMISVVIVLTYLYGILFGG